MIFTFVEDLEPAGGNGGAQVVPRDAGVGPRVLLGDVEDDEGGDPAHPVLSAGDSEAGRDGVLVLVEPGLGVGEGVRVLRVDVPGGVEVGAVDGEVALPLHVREDVADDGAAERRVLPQHQRQVLTTLPL